MNNKKEFNEISGMNIEEQISPYQNLVKKYNAQLVAVSKTKPNSSIETAYTTGQRVFGENKVQELVDKYNTLPKDIKWHMIGHLQRNKVKFIAPFVQLIHAVDSVRLLKEINKQAKNNDRIIDCLLQIHISTEETKFGFSYNELQQLLEENAFEQFQNIRIVGLMGMATNTKNTTQIRKEFAELKAFSIKIKTTNNIDTKEISMGMSGDYQIALEEGSTMVRIGSAIFGNRNYKTN